MEVVKRNGTVENLTYRKIFNSIQRANSDAVESARLPKEVVERISKNVVEDCERLGRQVNVLEVEEMVERQIFAHAGFEVGKKYLTYRYEKERKTRKNTTDDSILSLLNRSNSEIDAENANKNPVLNSTQRDYMAGEVSKDITMRYLLPKDIVNAHDEGVIHFHDADYFANSEHNCDLIDLEDMLQNGTVISGTKIEKPHTFSTACNITTQIIAQVASSQYGGQTFTLTHLAPFVEVSRRKFRREIEEEFSCRSKSGDLSKYGSGTADVYSKNIMENGMYVKAVDSANNELVLMPFPFEKFNEVVERRVMDDVKRGIQTIQFQTITLMTTNGQAPFVSVCMYLGEVEDGRTREDLAIVIEEMLKQRIQGIKNEVGAWIAPTFPKLLYVLEEDNIREGSKYWHLTELAAKCVTKRMVPDFISEKVMKSLKVDKNGEGHCYPCMGCVDGKSEIDYIVDGERYVENFEEAWIRLCGKYAVQKQPNGFDLYMDTDGVLIYDHIAGRHVKVFRMIRNTQRSWRRIVFTGNKFADVTDDHPFEVHSRGVVLAADLMEGDAIWSTDKFGDEFDEYESMADGERIAVVMSILPYEQEKYSYDVTTETEHFTFNGLWSHNCRSFLTPYVTEDSTPKYYGRFNQGVVTLNLPDVALTSKKDFGEFWRILDERLELCHRALRVRHEHLVGTKSDVAPILWQHGALARLKAGETIDKMLYGGYSTISLGYVGLYECVKYMTGHSHTEEEGAGFAESVMVKLNEACAKWRESENIDYSLYGTPEESTTYKFAKSLQRRFGIIKGITDKNYVTNSYHVPVFEHINAFSKISKEAVFQRLSPGGAISYIETPNMEKNVEAIIAVIKYIYDNIMYCEINTRLCVCQVCGGTGTVDMVKDDNGFLKWKCMACGNEDHTKINAVVRLCGYLGNANTVNQGRMADIHDRVYHL